MGQDIPTKIKGKILQKIHQIKNYSFHGEKSLFICTGDWERKNMKQICRQMKAISSQSLYLNSNHKFIVREVCHLSFPNLIKLDLSANQIQSVEHLSFITMPKLCFLELSSNKITNISPLRKSNWHCLNQISISNNRIVDGAPMQQFLVAETVSEIVVQNWSSSHPNQIYNLMFLFKFKSKKINNLIFNNQSMRGRGRINLKTIKNNLVKKFKLPVRWNGQTIMFYHH